MELSGHLLLFRRSSAVALYMAVVMADRSPMEEKKEDMKTLCQNSIFFGLEYLSSTYKVEKYVMKKNSDK